METWKITLIPTLLTLTVGGIHLFSVWKHRQVSRADCQERRDDTLQGRPIAMRLSFRDL